MDIDKDRVTAALVALAVALGIEPDAMGIGVETDEDGDIKVDVLFIMPKVAEEAAEFLRSL